MADKTFDKNETKQHPDAIDSAWIDVKAVFEGDEPLSCDFMGKINKLSKAVSDELDIQPKNGLDFDPVLRFAHLAKPHKFDARFNHYSGLLETYPQAYYATEAEYCLCYGENKYKNYESYRKTRANRLKKKEME